MSQISRSPVRRDRERPTSDTPRLTGDVSTGSGGGRGQRGPCSDPRANRVRPPPAASRIHATHRNRAAKSARRTGPRPDPAAAGSVPPRNPRRWVRPRPPPAAHLRAPPEPQTGPGAAAPPPPSPAAAAPRPPPGHCRRHRHRGSRKRPPPPAHWPARRRSPFGLVRCPAHQPRHTPPGGGGGSCGPPGPGCAGGGRLNQKRVTGSGGGRPPACGGEHDTALVRPHRRRARCQAPSSPRPLRPLGAGTGTALPAPPRGHGRRGTGHGGGVGG